MSGLRKYKAKTIRKPGILFTLLGKRTKEDRDTIIELLENDKKMRAETRERFAAMLLLDFKKMEEDQQDRFAAIMHKGNADERKRIACTIAQKP